MLEIHNLYRVVILHNFCGVWYLNIKSLFHLGLYYNDKLYEENTLSQMELFNKSLSEYLNLTEVEVRTLKTVMHGACFTLNFATEVQISNVSHIMMKRPWDIVVYFHNEGEQLWLLWYNFPIIMTSLQLDISTW
jgi:hypothetical protein